MKTITVTNNDTEPKRRFRLPFSSLEVGIFLVVSITLIIAAFFILKPIQKVDELSDSRRRSDISKIYDGITLYLIDKGGEIPTVTPGKDMPAVTNADILEKGANVEDLDALVPDYILSISKDPTGNSYKVGLLSNGRVAVATKLSTGEIYVVSQSSSSIKPQTDESETSSSTVTALPGGELVDEEGNPI